jgi:hypothetical protein
MKKIYKIILYGFLIWLIVFFISFAIYPLHGDNKALFESIMPIAIAGCVVGFATLYFKDMDDNFLNEGITIGIVWFAVNIIFDLFMFMEGPMKMSIGDYMMDIGFTYLMIPIITVGCGYLLECKKINE